MLGKLANFYIALKLTHIYNSSSHSSSAWSSLDDMIDDRYDHTCGVVENGEKGKEVIVVGGGEYSQKVLIYNVDLFQWRPAGSDLPAALDNAVAVHYEGSFILVGGQSSAEEFSDAIYMYNPATEDWTVLEDSSLGAARAHLSAMLVDKSAFPCVGGASAVSAVSMFGMVLAAIAARFAA